MSPLPDRRPRPRPGGHRVPPLPISSSGTLLILIPRLLGWGDQGLSFDIATNSGTLLAVILYFRRDLAAVAREALATAPAVWRRDAPAGARLAWLLALGTIPAAVVGLLAHGWISTVGRNQLLIACGLIVWGLLLGVADRFARERRDEGSLSSRDALLVGCAQALALVPGTSRSGITITALLLLGLSRPAAARFSFLLAVPVGLLAEAKDLLDHLLGDGIESGALAAMLLGVVVSAVAGYAVIAWLLAWLRRRSLMVFVVYRVAFGLALLDHGPHLGRGSRSDCASIGARREARGRMVPRAPTDTSADEGEDEPQPDLQVVELVHQLVHHEEQRAQAEDREDVRREDDERVLGDPKMAGIESTANSTSLNSMTMSTRNRSVALRFPSSTTKKAWPR